MKGRSFLFSVLAFSILLEVVIIGMVFAKVGGERLPGQIVRLTLQVALIAWLYFGRSHAALFLLAGYHMLVGVLGFGSTAPQTWLSYLLIGYHIGMSPTLYFHHLFESEEED